jgi:hypothetical protein
MRHTAAVGLSLAALLVAAVPAQAERRIGWRQVATATAAIVGDGAAVAWQEAGNRVVVTSAAGPQTIVQEPSDCAGQLKAIGQGHVLLRCPDGPQYTPRYAVVGIAGGGRRDVSLDPYETDVARDPEFFDALGSHWIGGAYRPYHVTDTLFYNWRTGVRRYGAADNFGPHHWLDLSFSGLGAKLCRPLARVRSSAGPSDVVPAFEPLTVFGRWALRGQWGTSKFSGRLTLGRCGTRPLVTLERGAQAQLGSGWLVWEPYATRFKAPRRIVALRLRDMQRYSAPVPRALGFSVSHTARALYASETIGPDYAPVGYRILMAALPP